LYAASALAANSILRSLFGAAFPLFTPDMYRNLGIHWASSVPAFLALACLPFPFLFWRYGERIRSRSKFAAEAAKLLQRMQAAQHHREDEADLQKEKKKEEEEEKDGDVASGGGVLAGPVADAADGSQGNALEKLSEVKGNV
jgi:hypothetical protein